MTKNLHYIFLLVMIFGFYHPDNKASWIVMQGSTLTVNGSTNVNTFQCDISNYNMPDTISMVRGLAKGQLVPMNGKLNLEIEAFDCHNKMMTSDLRKTLKSKQFPLLSVKFISINGFPDFKNASRITGLVDIGLAGVSKRFEINYVFSMDDKSVCHLKGNQQIRFSDFKLIPPSKLGGVIKAKDELQVEFILHMRPIS